MAEDKTHEIYWDYSGGLNRHGDKVSINEVSVEDLGLLVLRSLVKVLDMAEDEEKESQDEGTSLDKMNNSDTGNTDETDRNSIQPRSVTNENKTSANSELLTSLAVVDASMPREQSSVELARSKAVELSIPKTAAAVAEEKSRKRVSRAVARHRIVKRWRPRLKKFFAVKRIRCTPRSPPVRKEMVSCAASF
jgi:hypothetical protein